MLDGLALQRDSCSMRPMHLEAFLVLVFWLVQLEEDCLACALKGWARAVEQGLLGYALVHLVGHVLAYGHSWTSRTRSE